MNLHKGLKEINVYGLYLRYLCAGGMKLFLQIEIRFLEFRKRSGPLFVYFYLLNYIQLHTRTVLYVY